MMGFYHTLAYIPSMSFEGLKLLFLLWGELSSGTSVTPSSISSPAHSITDITELRPDVKLLELSACNCVVDDETLDFGVGGNGELAWRFSGLGEPRLHREVLLLDDAEACLECICALKLSTGGGIGVAVVVFVISSKLERIAPILTHVFVECCELNDALWWSLVECEDSEERFCCPVANRWPLLLAGNCTVLAFVLFISTETTIEFGDCIGWIWA